MIPTPKYLPFHWELIQKNNFFLVGRFAFKWWWESPSASESLPFLPTLKSIHTFLSNPGFQQASEQDSVSGSNTLPVDECICMHGCIWPGCDGRLSERSLPLLQSSTAPIPSQLQQQVKQLLTEEGRCATSSFWLCMNSTQACPGAYKGYKSFIYCQWGCFYPKWGEKRFFSCGLSIPHRWSRSLPTVK